MPVRSSRINLVKRISCIVPALGSFTPSVVENLTKEGKRQEKKYKIKKDKSSPFGLLAENTGD